MAVYLPLVAVLLAGGGRQPLSRFVAHESDKIILLTIWGTVLLVAGIAQRLQVSAAIGAFLVGIAVSGPMAKQTHRLLAPLRDLFAATFFFFFGLQIGPATLPRALPLAVGLGGVTALTKVLTGYWAARRTGVDRPGRLRAGMALVARGEFSIVIAGLGANIRQVVPRYRASGAPSRNKIGKTDSVTLNSVCGCASLSLARRHTLSEEQLLHLRVDQLSACRLANPYR